MLVDICFYFNKMISPLKVKEIIDMLCIYDTKHLVWHFLLEGKASLIGLLHSIELGIEACGTCSILV